MEKLQMLERRWYHNPEFPCSVVTINRQDLLFQTHWHEEIELLYAVDSDFEVTIDGESVTLPQGGAAVVNSGQLHAARLAEGRHGTLQILIFHPDIWRPNLQDIRLNQLIQSILQGKRYLPTVWQPKDPSAASFLASLLRLIDLELNGNESKQIAMRGEFYLMLANLVENNQILSAPSHTAPGRRHQVEMIRQPLQHIQQNYQQNLSIEELASLANLSESHFSRIFRQVLGQSVVEYVNEFRLRQAARMLNSTDARITDIAIDCGFPNISYFVRCFKRHYTLTPSDYRRRV